MNREVPLLMAALVLPAFAQQAQQVRFEVPRLGYVYDAEAKAVRSVAGVPGAAVLEGNAGGPATGSAERAWVSSFGFAVVQGKQGGGARLLRLESGESKTLENVGLAAVSGRYAAIWTGSSVEIWDGTALARVAQLSTAGLDGVRALAVGPDGDEVLAASETSLMRLRDGGNSTVWTGTNLTAAAYIDGGFAAFDNGRNKLLVSRGGETAETDGPLPGAASFAYLGNARLAFGGERGIAVLDLSSGAVQALATEYPVEEFLPSVAGIAQIRFRGSSRVALLELNAEQTSAQVEYLVAGGAR